MGILQIAGIALLSAMLMLLLRELRATAAPRPSRFMPPCYHAFARFSRLGVGVRLPKRY